MLAIRELDPAHAHLLHHITEKIMNQVCESSVFSPKQT